jgi:Flp pilus assembly protein TadG
VTDADGGSAAIEFALVLPLVILVLVASIEVLAVARSQLQLTHAAREAAREAASTPDPSAAVAAARSALPGDLASRAEVTVEREHRVGGKAVATIVVRHRLAASLFGGIDLPLRSRAVMRVEK